TAPLAFNVEDLLNNGVTLLGGGPNASVNIVGDGTGQLTIGPQLGDALARLTGDGLGNFGVSLGTIATARVDAGGQPILFRGTSTGNEADDTPIGSTEALVSFPGAATLFDVTGLGSSPLLFDPLGAGQAVKVLATAADTAFSVTQSDTSTLVAVTDQTT